ncbi:MAG: hypothetical protein AAF074_20450 [Pseudomonadota bacterium]
MFRDGTRPGWAERRLALRSGAGALALATVIAGAAPADDGYLEGLSGDDPWLAVIDMVAEQGCEIEPGELMVSAMERGIMPAETMDRLGETAAAGHLDSKGGDADGENLYILKNWKGC